MPVNSMVSVAKTFSGSMMMDFGISEGSGQVEGLSYGFDLLRHHLQETRAGGPVDHLVIAGERQADGVNEGDVSVSADRLELNRAHTQNGHLRWIQQRRETLDSQVPQVADCEGGACQVVRGDGAGNCQRGEFASSRGQFID